MQLRRLQTILYEFDRLHITDVEYAYLKLMTIFNPTNNNGKKMKNKRIYCVTFETLVELISFCDQIDAYRVLAYKELRDYINDRMSSGNYDEFISDSERLGRILLKLPLLAEIDTNIIEEIFFVGLIGTIR